jgi:hypothetical protein
MSDIADRAACRTPSARSAPAPRHPGGYGRLLSVRRSRPASPNTTIAHGVMRATGGLARPTLLIFTARDTVGRLARPARARGPCPLDTRATHSS